MSKFFQRHKSPKGTQGEIENLNNPTSVKQTEFLAKNFPTKKTPGPD